MLYEHSARQPRYPTQCGTGSFAPQHYCWFALDERLFICSRLALQSSQILASLSGSSLFRHAQDKIPIDLFLYVLVSQYECIQKSRVLAMPW